MKKKKRPMTLLEIMIVIFLIGLIASVIGYNMKGSLDQGKQFRSEQGAAQIRDILLYVSARDNIPIDVIVSDPSKYLKRANMAKDPDKLMKDGWGKQYRIVANGEDIEVQWDNPIKKK